MCDQNSNCIAELLQENRELAAQFDTANSNFWKTVNDQRAQRRAELLKKQKAGNYEQAE